MRHRVSGKKLGRDIKKRKALFKNLIASLISHGQVKTTEMKAKAVKGLLDKLVTKAKQGTLHARRQVLAFLPQKEIVGKLFDEVVPRFKGRQSGFTRIIKIGPRRGDNTPMVVMKWVEEGKLKIKRFASQSSSEAEKLKIKKKDGQNKADKGKRD